MLVSVQSAYILTLKCFLCYVSQMIENMPTVKLTDFGLSKMVDVDDMMKTAMFSTVVGTPGFMAPELYMKKPYNQAVDIFAMGLVFFAIYMQKGDEALCPVSCKYLSQIWCQWCNGSYPLPSAQMTSISNS